MKYEKVSLNYLEGGNGLISSPVQITDDVLSQEVMHGAPPGHT